MTSKGSFERSIKLMTTIYQDKGYKSRRDYLESSAEEYNIPLDTVLIIAETYGPSEDFDALVSTLEDYEEGIHE